MKYKLPSWISAAADNLELLTAQYKSSKISESEFKAHRVPAGIYEQRIKGSYMARVRCPAGMISPSQLIEIGKISEKYGSGRLHITTRQEIQLHDLDIDGLIPVLCALETIGLSTFGGGGNTVRNITASADAGISETEAFDVTPYAVALTNRLLEQKSSLNLPRKFKIAFSGSSSDSAYATINDLGFVAVNSSGSEGFRVFVAGGMGRMPQPGNLLHEFIPSCEVFEVAEAVKSLFAKYGNRRNKHTARLRFLWNFLGKDRFTELYMKERQIAAAEKGKNIQIEQSLKSAVPDKKDDRIGENNADFDLWKSRYCYVQPKNGLYSVLLPFENGDITAQAALETGRTVSDIGDDVIRFTLDQNIRLRNITEDKLPAVFQMILALSPLARHGSLFGNSVACAGAGTCQLGICLSRNALSASIETLKKKLSDPDSFGDFRIRFSGCSNSCGQHGLSHLGFFGKAKRRDGAMYPAYSVVAGARIDGKAGSALARTVADIPARCVPDLLSLFLNHYGENKGNYTSYNQYLDAEGYKKIEELCSELSENALIENDPLIYHDWGVEKKFSLEGRGGGECAAGLFDMIDMDLSRVRDARTNLTGVEDKSKINKLLYEILFYSVRALLVIPAGEAVEDEKVGDYFKTFILEPGYIDPHHSITVELLNNGERERLYETEDEIMALADSVAELYLSLDETLQFKKGDDFTLADEPSRVIDMKKDLRGVSCPMNFVKTKLALSQLETGQILEVLLDEGEAVENVPGSVSGEGHEVMEQNKIKDYWSVVIKKA